MKPAVPIVPLSIWKELFSVSRNIYNLKPWVTLDDLDLIVVRDPSTNETGHGVFMGSGGTLFGFCLYRGARGFHFYKRLTEGTVDPAEEDIFAMQDCLKLEFVSRSETEPEDKAIISQLGLTFKGKQSVPQFRSHIPEYAPWFMSEAEAKILLLGLRAGIHHCKRIQNGEAIDSLVKRKYLVYTPAGDLLSDLAGEIIFKAQWEPLPAPPSKTIARPIVNLPRISALRKKKLTPDTPWEADMFYIPSPIFDRERPYYTHLAVICQQSTGIALTPEIVPPQQPPAQSLADAICSVIEKHGVLPKEILVKSNAMADALIPLANALGFTVRSKKNLGTITMLKQAMYEQFMGMGGRGRGQ